MNIHRLSTMRIQVVIYTQSILYRIVYGYSYINSSYELFIVSLISRFNNRVYTYSTFLPSATLRIIRLCVKKYILILLMIFDLKQIFV